MGESQQTANPTEIIEYVSSTNFVSGPIELSNFIPLTLNCSRWIMSVKKGSNKRIEGFI
jgi:hypothetical protein